MRRLRSFFFFMGLLGWLALPAKAGPVFNLRELSLETTWQGDECQKKYSVNTLENIEWLSFETAVKLYDGAQPQKYSAIKNEITFLESSLMRDLHLSWQIEEAVKYRLDEIGAGYQVVLLPNWVAEFAVGRDNRTPKTGVSFYRQNTYDMTSQFRLHSLQYSLSLNHWDKIDEIRANTHEICRLYHSLKWAIASASDIGLFYEERTGNYPYQVTKNATSQGWGVHGSHGRDGGARLFWRYEVNDTLHGYSIPGRDQQYRLGMDYRLTARSLGSLSLDMKNHESFHIDPEFNPDEIITDTQKSYRDLKLTLEYQLRDRYISWNLGYWIERKEFFTVNEKGGVDQSFFGSFTIRWRDASLTARFSKPGSFGSRQMKYQLCLAFKQ